MKVVENIRETKADSPAGQMQAALEAQRESYLAEGPVSAQTRIDRLNRAIDLMVKYQNEIADALMSDFGHRSIPQSKLTDVAASVSPLKHAKSHVTKWMKAQKRKVMFPMATSAHSFKVSYIIIVSCNISPIILSILICSFTDFTIFGLS